MEVTNMKQILYLHAGAELYGADIVLLELVKNLNKDEFNPLVILPCYGPLVEKLKYYNIEVEVIPYPILRRKYFTPIGIMKYIKDYFKYSFKIKKLVLDKKIDVIHTNTTAVLEGIYLKKTLKVPQIWHIHEIIVKPRAVNKFLSYLVAKNSNEVITVSEAVREHLKSTGYFKKEIKVIYNGVDNKVFKKENETEYIRNQFNIPKGALIVGMIGRVNSWKGQEDFLEAMNTVLQNNKDVYAMLVGGVFEGEEWRIDELKKKLYDMKNPERVIFDTYRDDSKNLHSLYDIFVLPSTNPDPLPTVVLESMASGTPVVAYRHGGVCEMVKDGYNGLLVDVRNTKDLSDKINRLINDSKLRETMGNNSLTRQKEKFSLEAYVNNFIDQYRNI